jgi:hypothetical protein
MNRVLNLFKQNDYTNTSIINVNGVGISGTERVNGWSKDTFMFASLRGRVFDGLDLSRVEFFGCLLNGTSFRGANLRGARFIGCFSSFLSPPTDFRGSSWKNTSATGCHLNYLFDQEVPGFDCWPTEVVETFDATLSRRNDVRHRATTRLGTLGNPVVAPYLATLLADEEWDVRLMALEALALLRQQAPFPHRDAGLMKQMFRTLGDKYGIVQGEAVALIQTLKPDDEVLHFVINQMTASKSQDKLTGLRAAANLCQLDKDYSRLLDLSRVHELLSDESQLVREECIELLGILDHPLSLPWILECLNDPIAFVRGHAMSTIGWLSDLPEAHEIEHFLHDPDEDVRLYTLDVLEESDLLESKHLSLALADSSPKVLRAARQMQVEPSGEVVRTSVEVMDETVKVYAQSSASLKQAA